MNFYDWPVGYDILRRAFPKMSSSCTPEDFYARQIALSLEIASKDPQRASIACNHAAVERLWNQLGRPYYKLYPGIIGMLSRSEARVPARYVRLPFPALLLRLPEGHRIVELSTNEYELRSVLIRETGAAITGLGSQNQYLNERGLEFWMDFGETAAVLGAVMPYFSFQVLGISDEDRFIGELLEEWMGKERVDMLIGYQIPRDLWRTAIHLSIGACLVAASVDRLVEYDVLNRWRERYERASPEERRELEKKSRARGKRGWILGREIDLPAGYGCRETAAEGGVRRELRHSHLRSGHFHIVRFGKGRAESRVDWFRPTVVRPDLPAPTTRRGYRTKD